MHEVHDEYSQLDHDLAFSRELLGKECQACKRALRYVFFDKDSSSRDGYANICPRCKNTPRLSARENLSRMQEANFASEAVKVQRRENELEYFERDAKGRSLTHSDFIHKLRKFLGAKLIVAPAYFLDELSLYVEDGKHENGARYIGYIQVGIMNEFSEYKYDKMGVPIDEHRRGYRGILLKLIMEKYATEQQCEKVFGPCDEAVWCRTLFNWRKNSN